MKKIVTVLTVVIGTSIITVNAQSSSNKMHVNLSGGFKTEANLSTFSLSNLPDEKSRLNFGGNIGGFAKYNLSEHFAIQEDVLLNYKTSTMEL